MSLFRSSLSGGPEPAPPTDSPSHDDAEGPEISVAEPQASASVTDSNADEPGDASAQSADTVAEAEAVPHRHLPALRRDLSVSTEVLTPSADPESPSTEEPQPTSVPVTPPAEEPVDTDARVAGEEPVIDLRSAAISADEEPPPPAFTQHTTEALGVLVDDSEQRGTRKRLIAVGALVLIILIVVVAASPSKHAHSRQGATTVAQQQPNTIQAVAPPSTVTNADRARSAMRKVAAVIHSEQQAEQLVTDPQALQHAMAKAGSPVQIVASNPKPFADGKPGQVGFIFEGTQGQVQLEAASKDNITIGGITEKDALKVETMTVKLLPQTRLVLPADGMFPSGSAGLTSAGKQFVTDAARQLGNATSVVCVGYTDSQGTAASNYKLGLARAKAVCLNLMADDQNLKASYGSKGEKDPVASNATAAGRARNRRVELSATYPY